MTPDKLTVSSWAKQGGKTSWPFSSVRFYSPFSWRCHAQPQLLQMVSFLLFLACKMLSGKEGFHIFAECLVSWGDVLWVNVAAAAGNPIVLHHGTHLAGPGLGSHGGGKCQFRFIVICMNVTKSFTWELN